MLFSARFRIARATDAVLEELLTSAFMVSWKCVGGLPTSPTPLPQRSGQDRAARLRVRATPARGLDGENGGIPCPFQGKPYLWCFERHGRFFRYRLGLAAKAHVTCDSASGCIWDTSVIERIKRPKGHELKRRRAKVELYYAMTY